MKITIAQINTKCGDIKGNLDQAIESYDQARDEADLVVFPELTLTGYPPEDLLYRQDFIRETEKALDTFAEHVDHTDAIIGLPTRSNHPAGGLYNSAAHCWQGIVRGFYHKQNLPNYGVFDEKRYFIEGTRGVGNTGVFYSKKGGCSFGVTICEDLWVTSNSPVFTQARTVDVLINISASPFNASRQVDRIALANQHLMILKKPIVYCNLVGGQDELVFDGNSFALSQKGVIAHAAPFVEDLVIVDTDALAIDYKYQDELEEIWDALVLGTRDYVRKNGFHRVLIGLSGGIDSALVAAIATEALGKENVIGVLMPSRYSSKGSLTDSWDLAERLGIQTREIPIEAAHMAFEGLLQPAYTELFPTSPTTNADENVQARIRGVLLMALSNQSGAMVLTTGNKSEMSMGYATLYGDMCGGFAVIKDVPKTTVFDLARWYNHSRVQIEFGNPDFLPAAIPQDIIDKPPSAELRPDQLDSDSLPAYNILDPILEMYIEKDMSPEEIFDPVSDLCPPLYLIQNICRLVDQNEYKRRQSPPGVRISPKAFGKDRRLPIVNGWTR